MDPYTLHVTDALVNLTSGVTVAILWFQNRAERCFAFWSAAFAVFGAGLLLQGLVELHPLIGAAYYGGLGAGVLLIHAGFRSFDGKGDGLSTVALLSLAPPVVFLAILSVAGSSDWAGLVAFLLCNLFGARLVLYVNAGGADGFTYRRVAGITLATQFVATFAFVFLSGTFVDETSRDVAIPLADQICTIVLVTCLFGMSVERNNAEMEEMACRDGLTGALNRVGLLRRTSDEPVAGGLLVMDLDRFKGINDRYGHPGGDAVLREFAHRVSRCLPEGALFARMGGEEFVALLPGATQAETAAAAEAIRHAVRREPVDWDGQAIAMTVSVGLALHRGGEALHQTMSRADAALYRAKVDGRDRVAA